MADKLGNYKVVLIFHLLLGASCYMPVLWLQSEHKQMVLLRNDTQVSNSSFDTSKVEYLESTSDFNYIFPLLLVFITISFISVHLF